MKGTIVLKSVTQPTKVLMAAANGTMFSMIATAVFAALGTKIFGPWALLGAFGIFAVLQSYMIVRTYQDPYFISVHQARRSKTRNYKPVKVNRYEP
jgi:hypothetical protein